MRYRCMRYRTPYGAPVLISSLISHTCFIITVALGNGLVRVQTLDGRWLLAMFIRPPALAHAAIIDG